MVTRMKDELTKIKLTVHIPFDKPNKNGSIFTEEAVENAISSLNTNLPIIYKDNKNRFQDKVIGATASISPIVNWDFENKVCKMMIDGVVFHCGAEIIVNEMTKDGEITDFRIASIRLTV